MAKKGKERELLCSLSLSVCARLARGQTHSHSEELRTKREIGSIQRVVLVLITRTCTLSFTGIIITIIIIINITITNISYIVLL